MPSRTPLIPPGFVHLAVAAVAALLLRLGLYRLTPASELPPPHRDLCLSLDIVHPSLLVLVTGTWLFLRWWDRDRYRDADEPPTA
jgi:hypothetical protein